MKKRLRKRRRCAKLCGRANYWLLTTRNIKAWETMGDNRDYFRSNCVSEPPLRTTSPPTHTHRESITAAESIIKTPQGRISQEGVSVGAVGAGCVSPTSWDHVWRFTFAARCPRPPPSLPHTVPVSPTHRQLKEKQMTTASKGIRKSCELLWNVKKKKKDINIYWKAKKCEGHAALKHNRSNPQSIMSLGFKACLLMKYFHKDLVSVALFLCSHLTIYISKCFIYKVTTLLLNLSLLKAIYINVFIHMSFVLIG